MRKYEFQKIVSRFKTVKEWRFDVLCRAIDQHYGSTTNWLDITNDFEVELFFACCKFDEKMNYIPLRTADFKKEKDTYSVLFKADSILADLLYGSTNDKSGVITIGFQPFMRCHR